MEVNTKSYSNLKTIAITNAEFVDNYLNYALLVTSFTKFTIMGVSDIDVNIYMYASIDNVTYYKTTYTITAVANSDFHIDISELNTVYLKLKVSNDDSNMSLNIMMRK